MSSELKRDYRSKEPSKFVVFWKLVSSPSGLVH